MSGMLYYPGAEPPDAIVNHAILYWDFIATITDRQRFAAMPRTLRQVNDAGLYRPIYFQERTDLHHAFVTAFRDGLFGGQITGEHLPGDGEPGAVDLRIARDALERTTVAMDSVVRFPTHVISLLIQQGLIVRVGTDYYAQRQLKTLLFGAAARSVAALGSRGLLFDEVKGGVFAHTEDTSAYSAAHWPVPFSEYRRSPDHIVWEIEVGGLLPGPAPGTPIGQVLRFRAAYDDERRRLIKSVRRVYRRIRRYNGDIAQALSEMNDEITQSLTDYRRAARAMKIDWGNRSLMVALSVGGGAAGHYLKPGFEWLFTVGTGVTINLATSRTSHPVMLAKNGIDASYLHRIERKLTG